MMSQKTKQNNKHHLESEALGLWQPTLQADTSYTTEAVAFRFGWRH